MYAGKFKDVEMLRYSDSEFPVTTLPSPPLKEFSSDNSKLFCFMKTVGRVGSQQQPAEGVGGGSLQGGGEGEEGGGSEVEEEGLRRGEQLGAEEGGGGGEGEEAEEGGGGGKADEEESRRRGKI